MKVSDNPLASPHDRRRFLSAVGATGCGILGTGVLHSTCKAAATTRTKARFYKSLEKKLIRCELCFRHCLLEPGDIGECEIRVNEDGQLMTMGYGNPGALNVDPIEKKPFFHYKPGTNAYSIAVVGCNIDCKFCQNWQIAQAKPGEIRTRTMSPADVVGDAKKYECPSIAYTYSEPTVWSEYVMDCSQAGNKADIGSVIISNGTWDPKVLSQILQHVKAIKVDLKSIEPEYYRNICNAELQPVLDNIVQIRKSGVWLELVNLVVTSLNDSDSNFVKLSKWVKKYLGADVPVHFTRFHPMYKLRNLAPTPLKVLDRAYEITRSEGLDHVYVGNVPGHQAQNTVCPGCGAKIIERIGYVVKLNMIQAGRCKKCKKQIPGIWS